MGIVDMAGGLIRNSKFPQYASGLVTEAFNRAMDGVGPLPGAIKSAEKQLDQWHGDVDEAINALISSHVKLAAGQGFLTNLGGLVSAAVLIPANVSGLAVVQCHLVAAIAHLRGYDLSDQRVRDAVAACMVGPDGIKRLQRKGVLNGSPRQIAHTMQVAPGMSKAISTAVTAELMARAAGKRTVGIVGRRVPVLGGAVGAAGDGWSTRQIGKYAAKELLQQDRIIDA